MTDRHAGMRRLAVEHHRAGRHGPALDAMRAVVLDRLDPTDLNDPAVVAAGAGRVDVARTVLQAIDEVAPGHPDARENLAALGPSPLEVEALRAGSLGPALSPKLLGHLLGSPPPGHEALAARIERIPSATTPASSGSTTTRWRCCGRGPRTCSRTAPCWAARPARPASACSPTRAASSRLACIPTTGSAPPSPRTAATPTCRRSCPTSSSRAWSPRGSPRRGRWRPCASGATSSPWCASCTPATTTPLLEITRSALPDLPGDPDRLPGLWAPPPGARYEIALVDACKSWFGTRWFLERMAPATGPGFLLALQDFAGTPASGSRPPWG